MIAAGCIGIARQTATQLVDHKLKCLVRTAILEAVAIVRRRSPGGLRGDELVFVREMTRGAGVGASTTHHTDQQHTSEPLTLPALKGSLPLQCGPRDGSQESPARHHWIRHRHQDVAGSKSSSPRLPRVAEHEECRLLWTTARILRHPLLRAPRS